MERTHEAKEQMGAVLRSSVMVLVSGTRRCEASDLIRTLIQRFFDCGGLIHAAVGLAGESAVLDEALRVLPEGLIESELASCVNGVDLAVVHLVRR